MEAVLEILTRRVEQLLGRATGPLYFRLMVLRAFHGGQTLIVDAACAAVPYILFRSSATLLARGLCRKRACATDESASNITLATGKEEM
jgi:hypothetical protein